MEKQLLKDAALCAIRFLDSYDGKGWSTKRYKALKAIAELTEADLDNEEQDKECRYTAYEVLEKIEGKFTYEESAKKKINQYLKDLTKHLPSHEDMLKNIAIENKLTAIPSYKFDASTGDGKGNYTFHFITPIKIDDTELIVTSEKIPVGAIKYYLETIENLPIWIKWINNFELSEWRIKFIAGMMILALIVVLGLYSLLMMVFLNSQSGGLEIVRTFFGTFGIASIIFWPFSMLYLCVTNRIIYAPILLQPNDVSNAQIECVATNKIRESTGKPIRKLRMVSYVSTCPLCNSRIEVENGGKEFHRRLIGRCQEAPLEHVYSFDRALRIGWPLRSS